MAQAIAEDAEIEKPTAIGVAGKDGKFIVGRSSLDSAVGPNFYGNAREDEGASRNGGRDASTTSIAKMQRKDLSPLRIPRGNKLSHYVDRPSFRRRLSREASFASAKSMPDSVLSEGDLHTRQGAEDATKKRRGLRRDASAMADINHGEDAFSLTTTPTRKGKHVRRRDSQSSYEPSQQLGRKKLSFEAMSPTNRRGRSEGAVMGGSILPKDGYPYVDETETSASLPILELPPNKEGPGMKDYSSSSPSKRNSMLLHPLRPSASHRSIGQVSTVSTGTNAINGHQLGANGLFSSSPAKNRSGQHTSPMKHSEPPSSIAPEADTSVGFDTSDSAKLQRMKERARKRYIQSRIGKEGVLPRTSTHLHARDISRQSRMSRASTAGTFVSIGTRFSDGSFGATGGVRSRLAKTFGAGNNKAVEARARGLKLEQKRHGGRTSGKGGVMPGAVGTSAGGTKWVGQTFEVGKRFWEVVESREEELGNDTIDEEALEEERLDRAEEGEIKRRIAQENARSREASNSKTTEAVLDNFAKQAQEANNEHESPQSRQLTSDSQSVKQLPTTPALTFTGSDSEHSRKEPQTPPKASLEEQYLGPSLKSRAERPVLNKEASQASLISIPHENGRNHESTFDIENRKGWSDVVSFMSTKSSAKYREATSSSTQLVEDKSGLDCLQTGSNEEKIKRQEVKSDRSMSTIGKANNGNSEAPTATPSQTQPKRERKSSKSTGMSAREALSHPEPPLGAEDRYPVATYELLRQPSNPGVRPEGSRDDAASDHEVVARSTTVTGKESINLPTVDGSSSRIGQSSGSHRNRTISTASMDGKFVEPLSTSSTPLPKRMSSPADNYSKALPPINQQQDAEPGMLSILQDAKVVDTSLQQQKKSVQFQGANSLSPPDTRGFGASLFLRSSPSSEKDGLTLLAGRTKSISTGDAAPAPPQEVLSRNATPDGLASPFFDPLHSPKSEMITRQSILKRDRMLVRLAWTPSEDLPKDFNERESRKYQIYPDPFKEFMVVYRTGRLELWEDPSFVSKCLGHGDQLKLHAATSLKRGRAFISMYSPIDRIFCLTFTKDDDYHHRLLDLRRSGTCIWIFDARSMTIGTDWMWELSRELGIEIPDHIDVHLPALGVRVRIPVPEEMPLGKHHKGGGTSIASGATSFMDAGEGYKLISRDYVKKVVRKVVEAQSEWRQLCLNAEVSGLKFELAWRNGSTLDWIKEDYTTGGHKRDWAVLVGTMLSEVSKS